MRCLSLFSGIGGLDLAAEMAGMRTIAFCEADDFCRRVLAAHWPGVPIYDDVRSLSTARLQADDLSIDLICGGFPCQDISDAGRRAGIGGERSGLWREFARLVGELRPRYAVVENVSALTRRGLDRVLGDLAEVGYDAEWTCVQAAEVGAPHRRERLFALAYPNGQRRSPVYVLQGGARKERGPQETAWDRGALVRGASGRLRLFPDGGVHRMGDGVSKGLDLRRLRALGNAVVPAQAYPIFAAIAAYEKDIA